MSNYEYDTQQLEELSKQKERILWEAKRAIEEALIWVGRDELIDYLSVETRQQLFKGYVLEEHYNCLAKRYDILRMSSKILQDAKDGCC